MIKFFISIPILMLASLGFATPTFAHDGGPQVARRPLPQPKGQLQPIVPDLSHGKPPPRPESPPPVQANPPQRSSSGTLPIIGSGSTLQKTQSKKSTCPLAVSGESPILVLSIDGASVRGIAQFALLQAIEVRVNEELRKREMAISKSSGSKTFQLPNESITSMFDFFAGTSAGSVNVGGIVIPENPLTANTTGKVNKPKFTLTELREMLPDILEAAFANPGLRKVRTLGGALGAKFTAKPFEDLLQELGGGARISDTVKPVVITSYDLINRDVMNFTTYEACVTKEELQACGKKDLDLEVFYLPKDSNGFLWKDVNVLLWQAIRASSSASTYYKALALKLGGKDRALIDAGIFVMSPALLGWLEAQRLYPNRSMVFISISSGNLREAREVETKGATAGSLIKVLKPTIETALEGQQALTHIMMQELPNIDYHRLSFEVMSKEFDDISEENVKSLLAAAQKTIASPNFEKAIQSIVKALILRKEKNDLAPFVCKAKDKQMKDPFGKDAVVLKHIMDKATHKLKGNPHDNK